MLPSFAIIRTSADAGVVKNLPRKTLPPKGLVPRRVLNRRPLARGDGVYATTPLCHYLPALCSFSIWFFFSSSFPPLLPLLSFPFLCHLLCLPPLITQVKQRWARLVLGWETVKNGPQEGVSFLFSWPCTRLSGWSWTLRISLASGGPGFKTTRGAIWLFSPNST